MFFMFLEMLDRSAPNYAEGVSTVNDETIDIMNHQINTVPNRMFITVANLFCE